MVRHEIQPESPFTLEELVEAANYYREASKDLVMYRVQQCAIDSLREDGLESGDESVIARAAAASLRMPATDALAEAAARERVAADLLRDSFGLPADLDLNAFQDTTRAIKHQGSEKPLEWVSFDLHPLPTRYAAVKEVARLTGKTFNVQGDTMFATRRVISPDTDVTQLAKEAYTQDLDSLRLIHQDPLYEEMRHITLADVDAAHGKR